PWMQHAGRVLPLAMSCTLAMSCRRKKRDSMVAGYGLTATGASRRWQTWLRQSPVPGGASPTMVLAHMPAPGKSFVPHALMATLIAIWAGSFVVAKIGLESVTPFALVASRFFLGALCILPFFLRSTRAQRRGTFGPGVLAGMVLAIPYFLQMYGVRETTASMGGFVTGLIVLLVAVGGHFCFGSRIGKLAIVGLALGLVGIVVLCLSGDPDPGSDAALQEVVKHNTVRGILLQVGSAIGFACHILLLSHYGSRLAVAPFTFWQLAFTGVLAAIGTLLISGVSAEGATVVLDTSMLLVLGYLGVLATGMAIGIQAKVQHRIAPAHLALLFALQPLFAAIAGWAFQDDKLETMQWVGGALIVSGVIVASRDRTQ
ncbi:MAG: drug/metabolite transporter (DMT)-like permease, partial [Candidatus Azotimanducaceae bacterium]